MITLLELEKPSILNDEQHNQILQWMAQFLTTFDDIREYETLQYIDWIKCKLFDNELAVQLNKANTTSILLNTFSLSKYLLWDQVEVNILWPQWKRNKTWEVYDDLLIKYYIYPFMKDKTTYSDWVLYILYDLLKWISVQKTSKWDINMYFKKNHHFDLFTIFRRRWHKVAFEYYESFDREELLKKEIELWYINKNPLIWDKNRQYAYTHLMRLNSKYIFPAMAIKLIMNWSKYNSYITTRQQGKTSFAADRAYAELLSNNKWFGIREWQVIRFFTKNAKEIGWQFISFLKWMIWKTKDFDIWKWLKLFTINERDQIITCNLTWHKVIVTSIRWITNVSDNDTWEWLACDCAIIDEAFRDIPYKFWRSFNDRFKNEWRWCLFITTINEETTINHWLYDIMIKWEALNHNDYNTVRSSYYSHDVTYQIHFKKQWKKLKDFYKKCDSDIQEVLKESWEDYVLKRYLCSIINENVKFDTSWRLIHIESNNEKDLHILSFDMWGLYDKLWITVFNVKTKVLVKAEWLNMTHLEIIKTVEKYKSIYPNNITVWDIWGSVWQIVYTFDKDKLIDYWLYNTSWKWISRWKYYNSFWIPFNMLVSNWMYFLHNIAKISLQCEELISQFSKAKFKKSDKLWNTTLVKKGKKDNDQLFSFLIIAWLLVLVFELIDKKSLDIFLEDYNYNDEEQIDDWEYSDIWYISNWLNY